MVVKCVGAYNVEVLRFTRVDSCGRPIFGPCSTLVVDCFETVSINADIEDGEEIAPVNANGKQCFFIPAPKLDRGFEVVANFTKKYPNLFTALNPNWLQAIDELGNITGYQHIPEVSLREGVAIEGWESVAGTDVCTPGAPGAWNYFLLPYVTNWARGDLELGNQVHSEEWTGHTISGNAWGTGPYDVRLNASTLVAGPLMTALDSRSQFYDEVVQVAPPTATCECIPLSNPAAPVFTLSSCDADGLEIGITGTAVGGRPMSINWGDGDAPEVLVTAVELTHTYALAGSYTVAVRYSNLAMEEGYLVVSVPCP
jgi:hypothetical protein